MYMKRTHEQEVIERIKQSDEYRLWSSRIEGFSFVMSREGEPYCVADLEADRYVLRETRDSMLLPDSPIYKRISREVQQRIEIAAKHLNWQKSGKK
jgi:hypothetical protein